MSAIPLRRAEEIIYPESDGQPMADNTLQFQWITTLVGELQDIFRHHPQVFVAGDLLWYPVAGDNKLSKAPDAMVVFGRPQGYRGSYKQWEEAGIAPQCVFEILSPTNTVEEMNRKLNFYNRYGVEEYYLYAPESGVLKGWLRAKLGLQPIESMNGWISPRLKIRFELENQELTIYRPDGRRFASYVEQAQRADTAEHRSQLEFQARQLAERQVQEETKARRLAEQRAQSAEVELARLKMLLDKK